MKKVLLVVLVVVVVLVGAVVITCQQTASELTPLAEQVLRDLSAGKAAEVHAAAADEFREKIALDAFRRWAAEREARLGAFVRIVRRTGASVQVSTSEGTTGKVALDLEYERGTTKGEVHFAKVDGTWRLLGLQVEMPAALAAQPDRGRLEPLSREALDLLGRGELVALYERFSPELKQGWPAEKYQTDLGAFRARMGEMGEVSFLRLEDLPEGYVAAHFDVAFANGPAAARVKWFWRSGAWEMLGFSVERR